MPDCSPRTDFEPSAELADHTHELLRRAAGGSKIDVSGIHRELLEVLRSVDATADTRGYERARAEFDQAVHDAGGIAVSEVAELAPPDVRSVIADVIDRLRASSFSRTTAINRLEGLVAEVHARSKAAGRLEARAQAEAEPVRKWPAPFGGIDHKVELSPGQLARVLEHFAGGCRLDHTHNFAIQGDYAQGSVVLYGSRMAMACARAAALAPEELES